jgi:hypothetical protein
VRFLLVALTALIVSSQAAFAAVNPLDTTMVLVNQIGYDQREVKTFLVQSPKDLTASQFVVKDQADGKTVYTGELQPLGMMKDWAGEWAQLRSGKVTSASLRSPEHM